MKAAIKMPNQSELLNWSTNPAQICEQIRQNKSQLKILLKTCNEAELLGDWIEHHARIVGPENLILADNLSDDVATLALLRQLAIESCTFQFEGFHNDFHDRAKFSKLYQAVCESCDYFAVVDTDERLVWVEDNEWIGDSRLLQKLEEREPFQAIPGNLIWNIIRRDDLFIYDGSRTLNEALIRWGKPIISSQAEIPAGHRCHNIQFPQRVFGTSDENHLFQLHLANLYPEQRIRANMRKLVSWEVIDSTASVEDVLSMSMQPDAKGYVVAQRCIYEIRKMTAAMVSTASETDNGTTIQFRDDGQLLFSSEQTEAAFRSFVHEGGRILRECFATDQHPNNTNQTTEHQTEDKTPLIDRAFAAIRGENWNTAQILLQEGADKFPDQLDQYGNPVFRKELLRLFLKLRRWHEARDLISSSEDSSRDSWHHILFARALDADGLHDEALAHWKAFLNYHPDHPEALAALNKHTSSLN